MFSLAGFMDGGKGGGYMNTPSQFDSPSTTKKVFNQSDMKILLKIFIQTEYSIKYLLNKNNIDQNVRISPINYAIYDTLRRN